MNCENPTEQKFMKITEKVVVNLTLKVLQNQQGGGVAASAVFALGDVCGLSQRCHHTFKLT